MTVARTICLGFLYVIAIGTILLMLPFANTSGTWGDPIVALFTSTSAVCVTGLSVVDVGTYYSFWGELLIVALVQIGGLGYMTATTFLLLVLGRRFGLRDKIAIQQSLDQPGLEGVLYLVRSIIAATLVFELTGVFLLLLVFVPDYGWTPRSIWLAIFHSVNAFNNAGFSVFPDNLIRYASSPLVNLIITGLIIAGGIGYQVIMETYLWARDRWQRRQECAIFSLNFKIAISTTLFLLIAGTLVFLLLEYNNPDTLGKFNLFDKLMAAWFQSVTPRTAGFNTIDIGKMTEASLFMTIALMFIGTNPGGTGGGVKTTTLRVLFSCTKSVLQGQEVVLCYQRQIAVNLILKAVGVVFGSLILVIAATTLIEITDPQFEFIQTFFEVVSAFGTVGLSTGITAKLSVFAKLIITATMYMGRVGVLLLMSAIIGEPKPRIVNYPEENLLVG